MADNNSKKSKSYNIQLSIQQEMHHRLSNDNRVHDQTFQDSGDIAAQVIDLFMKDG